MSFVRLTDRSASITFGALGAALAFVFALEGSTLTVALTLAAGALALPAILALVLARASARLRPREPANADRAPQGDQPGSASVAPEGPGGAPRPA